MTDEDFFIVGANGQLGTALKEKYPRAKSADIDQLDIADRSSVEAYDWSGVRVILNAAAYTNVDGAETDEGRISAWRVNAAAVANLAAVARQHDILLVHISTDYVFDGRQENHAEDEPFSPLNVYGASKAAGDIIVTSLPKYYLLRTSWVIGTGKNFVRTMLELGQKSVSPTVVADQFGRPTFTIELVRAIDHLLTNTPAWGTYNVSNGGDVVSWADLTRAIFKSAGFNLEVTDATSEEYFAGKQAAVRPKHSAFNLAKVQATGFKPTDWRQDLETYIKEFKA